MSERQKYGLVDREGLERFVKKVEELASEAQPVDRAEFERLENRLIEAEGYISQLLDNVQAMNSELLDLMERNQATHIYTVPSRQQGKSWLYERYMEAKRAEPQPDSTTAEYIRYIGRRQNNPPHVLWGKWYAVAERLGSEDTDVMFHNERGLEVWPSGPGWQITEHPAQGCHTKKEPQPDSDGWIPWHGGECPVPYDTKVEVWFRDNEPAMGPRTDWAKHFVWRHSGEKYDIIAYRPAK